MYLRLEGVERMNIFVLDANPITAARMMCDKHIPKMVVETAQMLASALRRHGATDDIMPIAKTTGRPYKGGYHNHPCTVWTGDTQQNFLWLVDHGLALSQEYIMRFGKIHACSANAISLSTNALRNADRLCPRFQQGTLPVPL